MNTPFLFTADAYLLGENAMNAGRPRAPRARSSKRDWRGTAERRGRPWDAQLVGTIKGYPATPEAFAARRARLQASLAARPEAMTRQGIPDGFGGRRAELEAAYATAHDKAERAYEMFRQKNWVDWGDAADVVMTELLTIALHPAVKPRVQIAAARVALEYCRVKPKKGEARNTNAAEWLAALATS